MRVCWAPEQSIYVGARFQGVRIVFALVCGSAGASESVWVMTQRIIVVGVTVTVGQVKFGPASPNDDEVLTPSGVRHTATVTQPGSYIWGFIFH